MNTVRVSIATPRRAIFFERVKVTDDSRPFDDDGTPWAPPEIRKNYEAALGRFILAFNQVDNQLTEIIETVLRG